MSNYVIADPVVGAGMPASNTGTWATSAGVYPPVPFGYEVRAQDKQTGSANVGAGVFVMAQGSNVASVGQLVHLINNSAVLLDSANSASFYPIGLAAGAMTATNVWGWVQVVGVADYVRMTNTSGAAGIRVCLGSTAGQFGTVTALGSRIQGLILPNSFTSSASASITMQINRPFVIGVTASN